MTRDKKEFEEYLVLKKIFGKDDHFDIRIRHEKVIGLIHYWDSSKSCYCFKENFLGNLEKFKRFKNLRKVFEFTILNENKEHISCPNCGSNLLNQFMTDKKEMNLSHIIHTCLECEYEIIKKTKII